MRMWMAALVLAPTVAWAQEGQKPVEPMDLYRLEQPVEPQISPDGRTVLYLRQTRSPVTDRVETELWRIGADGQGAALLVGADKSPSSPRWSPDGRAVAFLGREAGKWRLFALDLADPRVRALSEPMLRPSGLTWSADGSMLAYSVLVESDPLKLYTLPEPPKGAAWAPPARLIDAMPYRTDPDGDLPRGERQVFVAPADGSAPPRAITSGPGDWGSEDDALAFTRDGAAVIASADLAPDAARRTNQADLYRIPVGGGPPVRLTEADGFETSPAISPDGRTIAYVGWRNSGLSHQQTDIFVVPVTGGEARNLTAAMDRTSAQPQWRADGRAVYFLYQDQGVNRLGEAPLAGAPRALGARAGNTRLLLPSSSGGTYSAGAGAFVYPSVAADRPPALAIWRGGRERTLLDLNAGWRAGKIIGALEELWVPSSADGRKIHAWVLFPPNFDPAKRYPLALDIHGGPHIDYGPAFSITHHLYAAAGYVTVFANPRGSIGYGLEFAALIDKAYPGEDHDDLMSVVDAVAARPYIDPKRLYIGGGSGGGVLTAWAISKTDRFAAASVKRPVINWTSEALSSDITATVTQYWFEAPPWEKPEAYWARSPLSRVGSVNTPTLIITGENDFRTPMSESEQYFQALQSRGVESVLMRMPGASHGFGRPSQWLAAILATIGWYDKHAPKKGEDVVAEAAVR